MLQQWCSEVRSPSKHCSVTFSKSQMVLLQKQYQKNDGFLNNILPHIPDWWTAYSLLSIRHSQAAQIFFQPSVSGNISVRGGRFRGRQNCSFSRGKVWQHTEACRLLTDNRETMEHQVKKKAKGTERTFWRLKVLSRVLSLRESCSLLEEKDLHAKANQEGQKLSFLFCLPKLSLLYLDMYFCPHKTHGKSRQIHYHAEANTQLCDVYRNA